EGAGSGERYYERWDGPGARRSNRGVGARGGGRRPGQGARAQGPLRRRARRPRPGAVDRGAAAAEHARRGLPIGAGGVRRVAWRWRAGPDLKRRELCTVATTAVLGTAEQLHSHLRGALNTGASAAEIEAVLGAIDGDLDAEQRGTARKQWEDVKKRKL